jgi:TP901 family phage tail tape measure protein
MAEEIINKLGFDASDAISALEKLDTMMANIESRMTSLGSTMQSWNGGAGKTVAALKQIASNASDAADAMNKLMSAFAKSQQASVQVQAPIQGAPGTSPVMGTVTAQAGTAQQAARAAATALTQINAAATGASGAIAGAKSNTERWTVTWETMARVVATQAIVRAMSQIRDAIREAYEENVKFARSLNLIRTIEPQQSVAQLGTTVRKLSDEMNMPILDVSKGMYDVVSQQVEGAKAQQDVLKSAMQFAKVTGSSTAESVQVLTSTVHAFDASFSDVDAIASKFFRTFDVGNVRAQDFVTSFGRVAPVAKEVGASLDEVLAAYAALTLKGVTAEEAATQIAASFNAFIKPSKEMGKALKEMGVPSGADAFKTFGYMGAIQKSIGTTSGTAADIGKLFTNIRAMRDVMGLAADDAKLFNTALEKISQTSRTEVKTKFGEMMDTDVEKATAALNRLKNYFTVDLGAQLTKGLAIGLDKIGTDNVIAGLRAIAPVAAIATAAIGTLGAGLLVSAVNTKLATAATAAYNTMLQGTAAGAGALARSVATLGFQFAALSAMAYVGGSMIGEKFVEVQRQAQQNYRAGYEKDIQAFRDKEMLKIDAARAAEEKIVQQAEQTLAGVRRVYFRQLEAYKSMNQEMIADAKATMDRLIEAANKQATAYRQTATEAARNQEESVKRQESLRGQFGDTQFRHQNDSLPNAQKALVLANRADGLASTAARKMAEAKSTDEYQVAAAIYQRAQAMAQEASSAAQSSQDSYAKLATEETIERVLSSQISAEQRFQETQKQVRSEAERQAAIEEKRVSDMKQAAKEALDNMNLFDKQGKPLSEDERTKRVAKAQEALAEFQKLAMSSGKFDISQMLDIAKLQDKLQVLMGSAVTPAEISEFKAVPEALAKLSQDITQGVGLVEIAVKLVPDGVKLPKDFGQMDFSEQMTEIGKAITQQATKANEMRQTRVEQFAIDQRIAAKQKEITAVLENSQSRYNKFAQAAAAVSQATSNFAKPGGMQEEADTIQKSRQTITDAMRDATLTEAKYKQLAQQIVKDYETKRTGGKEMEWEGIGRSLLVLQEIAQERDKAMANLAKAPGGVDAAAAQAGQKMQEVKTQMEGVNQALDQLNSKAQGAGQSLQQVKPAESDTSSIDSMTSACNSLASAAAQATGQLYQMMAAAAAAQAAETVTAANGGPIRRFATGGSVGTDTIPAMLSPDEFVVNSRSARRFASQLIAMNAGIQPVFRSDGGSVTNIGDINVTVGGGGSGRQTARSIANELRRELRRKTSTL